MILQSQKNLESNKQIMRNAIDKQNNSEQKRQSTFTCYKNNNESR